MTSFFFQGLLCSTLIPMVINTVFDRPYADGLHCPRSKWAKRQTMTVTWSRTLVLELAFIPSAKGLCSSQHTLAGRYTIMGGWNTRSRVSGFATNEITHSRVHTYNNDSRTQELIRKIGFLLLLLGLLVLTLSLPHPDWLLLPSLLLSSVQIWQCRVTVDLLPACTHGWATRMNGGSARINFCICSKL